ncbi:hypothetical protein Pmar_PMAR015137 [Perkinsus marinus ATCC 50983]|uniref:RING-type domain-containing protein n=1 Tax=Perkinsus marinus (strain ATCC 50983 / TXsc) TaxID=423536 RepID=C5KFY4_PERM5|nr:hypothetical protein Pmar_PMAR018065 [Perkinsus marinus ATCC 50983]XP_002784813.1 hypothetical protein Pmar_PMAR015137 [Perkinsus marinus ATCC 50983]EER12810.1 hypothetical protein Pmar_PMAR018065 [Perkinsus marinus ATCC 50983]EER16609.1 hypothetical protein Pmar_PMAR015137 [Perkinsus marinus ATCC 50983]|eukprot:XP_002781015.1 hypothetical protein Pmar_PMAR018065 [Perkinsus marinus ATCC 50983]
MGGLIPQNFFSYSNVKGKQSDEMLCAICLEDFRAEDAIAELGCSHVFHEACFRKYYILIVPPPSFSGGCAMVLPPAAVRRVVVM